MKSCRLLLMVVAVVNANTVFGQQLMQPGIVSDVATAHGIAGASLRVTPAGAATTDILLAGRTRDDGTFDLPSTEVAGVLEVSAPGYATKRVVWPHRQGWLAIELEHGTSLITRFVDDSGSPIQAIGAITIYHPGNVVTLPFRSRDGVVEMVNAPSGPAMIVARAEEHAAAVKIIELSSGERHDDITVTLRRAGSVGVTVVNANGARLPDAVLVAEYGDGVSWRRTLANYLSPRRTDNPTIDFEIRNIVPDVPLSLSAMYDGKRSGVATVEVNPGEHLTGVVLVVD